MVRITIGIVGALIVGYLAAGFVASDFAWASHAFEWTAAERFAFLYGIVVLGWMGGMLGYAAR
jgi:hypothetical protein